MGGPQADRWEHLVDRTLSRHSEAAVPSALREREA